MTTYGDIFARDLRLAILRSLADLPGSCNDSLLRKRLRVLHHPATGDQVAGALAWLAEQGLVRLEPVPGLALQGVVLLDRGAEVAAGRAVHPGVDAPARPRA